MENTKAIPDIVTIIGPMYFQPISDLVASLVSNPRPKSRPEGSSFREGGYSPSITILLIAMFESFVARVRYCKNDELPKGAPGVPGLLLSIFPDLPNYKELTEVYLLRNIILHNHIWEIDVRKSPIKAPTIKTPQDLKTQTNKNYYELVDQSTRKTKLLCLNVNPVAVDRIDVLLVFKEIWKTLEFMNKKDFSVCPLSNDDINFKGQRIAFHDLIGRLQESL